LLRRIEGRDEFDVILWGVRMLERNGLERWKRLAAKHPDPVARIVFVTRERMSEGVRMALRADVESVHSRAV
jgi:DNA-binding NarL/FixJ family response regulator